MRLTGRNETTVPGSHGTITVADPWLPSTADGSDIVVARAGEPVETIHIAPAHQYPLEADSVAEFAAQQQSPNMSWAATLGNAQVLDSWRSTIGLQYPFEADSAPVPTASGRPLERRDDAAMHYGTVAGVAKQVARLVIGCDNQETLGHASVMFDDFFERGGNAFDTAHIYGGGRQEQLLGQWVANRGIRKDVFSIGKGAHTPYCDPASLARQLEEGKLRVFGGSNWTPARFVEANAYAAKHGKRALPR
ncbi:hypothetical protein ART_0488 [Arthrobacter sp. PAMC 25486]|uniref:aldo/keto reductase n=1 Tax=Arthrobacter sp. PAMC 25486 TaxID=1494608 RepID=UPI000535E419|nr:aldo/keto reductase [Arthrobacter sp. PAMC 25486]AIY00087.1 hypothetical protein ART_0488 [Arthrobacter sp. PAMC 25486]